jgi:hypothetical protein
LAIRRRRKKLTNLLSTLDRRVKGLELRPIDLLSASAAAAIQATAQDVINVIVSDSAPYQYRPIHKAYFYGSRVTGAGSRVELYLESDLKLNAKDRAEVSGVNGTATTDLELSSDNATVVSVASDPWDEDGRKSWRYTPTAQESNLSNSVLYSTNVAAPAGFTGAQSLLVKVEIESYQASESTVRINLAGPHKFQVNDAVYVELGIENPIVFGLDGLYRITAVDPSYIEYEIISPLAEPINVTPVVTIIRYVYAVAHEFVREGATWIDNSGDTDVVFVWRDLRWISFSSYVGDDGVAPGPVTNLAGESSTRGVNGIQAGVATVTLTWTNPTTNASAGPLDDLFGFDVWYRYSTSDNWNKSGVIPGDDSEWTQDGFEVPKNVTFKVYAVDSGGLKSEGTEITIATTPAAKEIKQPTAPIIEQYLGTPRFTWDGLQTDFTTPPLEAYEVEVHLSTIDGFSIVNGSFPAGTFYGKFSAIPGGYLIVNAADLTDGNDYYARFILTDIYGNKETSQQATFRAKVTGVVTFDLLDVGSLTAQLITGLQIQTGGNVASGAGDQSGLRLDTNGLRGYNDGGQLIFDLNANTGNIFMNGSINIGGYATTDALNQGLASVNNTTTAQEIIDSLNSYTGGTEITGTVINENSLITGLVATNKFIAVGSSGDINAGSTTIDGGKITTNTLNANRISGGTIDATKITVTNIDADRINAGTLQGRSVITSVDTSSNSQRVLISASSQSIKVYNTGDNINNHRGKIQGTSQGILIYGQGDSANLGVSGTVVSASTGISNGGSLQVGRTSSFLYGPGDFSGTRPWVHLSNGSTSLRASGGSTAAELYMDSSRIYLNNKLVRIENLAGSGTAGVSATSLGSLIRTTSDERLKTAITDLGLGLDLVNKLRPVRHKWSVEEMRDADETPHYGLIAQEVKKALEDSGSFELSNLINTYKNGETYSELPEDQELYSFNYEALVPILINAIKELSSKVETLEDRLNEG